MKTILISLTMTLTFWTIQCQNNTNNKLKTVVNKSNASDIAMYPAAPYFQDGAGYNGIKLENLPVNRIVNFVLQMIMVKTQNV